MSTPLRLMIYDRSCRGLPGLPGLSHSWSAGGRLYGSLGRLDAFEGFESWAEGLRWLAELQPDRPIGEIQFWGHGQWGNARVHGEVLDREALHEGHPLRPSLEAIRERFTEDGLWWFRTCETFGARAGHDLAMAWTDFFGGRAAGHTHIIHLWQSGLHGLRAGARPEWPATEGILEGTPEAPRRARNSAPWRPRTVHCLKGEIPDNWFAT